MPSGDTAPGAEVESAIGCPIGIDFIRSVLRVEMNSPSLNHKTQMIVLSDLAQVSRQPGRVRSQCTGTDRVNPRAQYKFNVAARMP